MKAIIVSAFTALLLASPAFAENEKSTFLLKHPKLCKFGRGVRRGFQLSMPVLQGLSYIGTAVGGFYMPFALARQPKVFVRWSG